MVLDRVTETDRITRIEYIMAAGSLTATVGIFTAPLIHQPFNPDIMVYVIGVMTFLISAVFMQSLARPPHDNY